MSFWGRYHTSVFNKPRYTCRLRSYAFFHYTCKRPVTATTVGVARFIIPKLYYSYDRLLTISSGDYRVTITRKLDVKNVDLINPMRALDSSSKGPPPNFKYLNQTRNIIFIFGQKIPSFSRHSLCTFPELKFRRWRTFSYVRILFLPIFWPWTVH